MLAAVMSHVRFIFRPGLSLAGAAVLALLVSLGSWQVRRLGESRAWIAEMTGRMRLAAVEVTEALERPEDFTFRRVVAEGRYDPAETVLLERQYRERAAGVHVLTPLRLTERPRALLVDRGFVPLAEVNRFLATDTATGMQRVQGILRAARRRELPDRETTRQLRWHRPDVAGIERQLPYPLESALLIRGDDGSGSLPLGETPEPGARVNHLHYAITWYGTAVALLGVLLALQIQREGTA
jgi:surfeit locus 1 family protein